MTTPTGLNPNSRFALVHKLAAKERLRRHEVGCIVCQQFPNLCVFRKAMLKRTGESDERTH